MASYTTITATKVRHFTAERLGDGSNNSIHIQFIPSETDYEYDKSTGKLKYEFPSPIEEYQVKVRAYTDNGQTISETNATATKAGLSLTVSRTTTSGKSYSAKFPYYYANVSNVSGAGWYKIYVRAKYKKKYYGTKDSKGNKVEQYYYASPSSGQYSPWYEARYDAEKDKTNVIPSNLDAPSIDATTDTKVRVYLTGLEDKNCDYVQFRVYKLTKTSGGNVTAKSLVYDKTVKIISGIADFAFVAETNATYTAIARGYNSKSYEYSASWSPSSGESSSPSLDTVSWAPEEQRLEVLSSTSVRLRWSQVTGATSYEIQYAVKQSYFGSSSMVQSVTVDDNKGSNNYCHYEVTGLDTGTTWYFRIRAQSDNSKSKAWSSVISTILGRQPSAPTTWSSTSTAMVGESINLYWVHNSTDGSSLTKSNIRIWDAIAGPDLDDAVTGTGGTFYFHDEVIENTTDEFKKDLTQVYSFSPTGGASNGGAYYWKVRTKGVSADYGDWSAVKMVTFYGELSLTASNPNGGNITSYPLQIDATVGTLTSDVQYPIGYTVTVTANETYETTDTYGNRMIVARGAAIFNKYYAADPYYYGMNAGIHLSLTPNQISLAPYVSYNVKVTATMNSGLFSSDDFDITTAFGDNSILSGRYIALYSAFNSSDYSMNLRPYLSDETGNHSSYPSSSVLFSIYRTDQDGSMETVMENFIGSELVDPHVQLDYGRYRVVARETTYGTMIAADFVIEIADETYKYNTSTVSSIVLTWDEATTILGEYDGEPLYTTMLLELPFNINVSENHEIDVTSVNYIGRKYPVAYFGTGRTHTASWSTDIPKSDVETLRKIRHLADWGGNVYVREPSGTGYYATVSISFNINHNELVIPVSISLTRVESEASA